MVAAIRQGGLEHRVLLHGQRPRAEVLDAMASAAVLLHPSMRDAASWVVAEALTIGCPIVCLRTGGPAVLLRSGGGIAVEPGSDLVARLAEAVAAAAGSGPSAERWTDEHLPELVDSWYRTATNVPSQMRAAAGTPDGHGRTSG
jgi:glycosyltransferase involved in cell wall biosynthesis